jgi:uncharacterized protein
MPALPPSIEPLDTIMHRELRQFIVAAAALAGIAQTAAAQQSGPLTPEAIAQRIETSRQLDSLAIIDRKVFVTMRDGTRLATDIYRPKTASGPVPVIFVRTPYNFNYWDVRHGVPGNLTAALDAIKRGYAYVLQNERGHYFSEGKYDILGPPLTDGYDAISWLSRQSWSNGKVGLVGCSSTAEWQLGVVSTAPPGLAAVNPQGFGAGVGRVGPYWEWGNWYKGGAFQLVFLPWIYAEQNQVRPTFPPNTSQADLIRVSRYFDLAPQFPPVDWAEAVKHLPETDIVRYLGGPPGLFSDSVPVPDGGRMIERTPGDSAWYRGGFYTEDMSFNVPGLWFMSWYDLSIGPNLATYNHIRATAKPEIANEQYAVIAPTLHCAYKRATEHTVVGDLDVGDARLDYDALTYGWFDHFLKGENNGLLDTLPKIRYYTLGLNKWQASDVWPPRGAKPVTYYLTSGGAANSLAGDGVLALRRASADKPDTFSYDPQQPVPTHGGNVTPLIAGLDPGARDQTALEARRDVLVYTTEPLTVGTEVSGPIDVTLYVSSNRKDTDFTVKLIDVYPDGRAFNLDDAILRARYREGYTKEVWFAPGQVYKIDVGPLNTSDYFAPGHRIRIEVSSSNFPRYDRNLNTGGRNYDETESLVAANAVHHSKEYPSRVTLTVVPRS